MLADLKTAGTKLPADININSENEFNLSNKKIFIIKSENQKSRPGFF